MVVVLADDQGWGDLSLHGNKDLATPRIDSLAEDGTELTRFFVCPVCAPTRAEFLTGRYHPRGGVRGVSRGAERLDADETTIADHFRRAGYRTAAFGKWHNGTQAPYHPVCRGFDQFYGFCSGHWGHYFSPPLEHSGRLVRGDGYVTDDFTSRAIQFLEQPSKQPFFVLLAYCTPHSPMQVPETHFAKFADRQLVSLHREPQRQDLDHSRAALAMCENIDWNVGRVLDALDRQRLADDTIVVYFSDNGPNGYRYNDGLKGKKGTTDEGGVRSPLLLRWPGKIPADKQVSEIAGAIDLLPTLASLADVSLENPRPLDGVDLSPLVVGDAPDWPTRMIFSHWAGRVSVRTPTHRLDAQERLYDMQTDPGQQRDIAADEPALTDQLIEAAAAWRRDVFADAQEAQRPFTIGGPPLAQTILPARDAVASGEIERSSRHPNCSFFKNWRRTEDEIAWDVDVLRGGDYQATLYYTCRDENVGAVLELGLGEARCQRRIDEAHDPPLVGAAEDRVPRSESYVKDFRPLELGTLTLEAGRGRLTLRALEIPGAQAVDVRMVVLTR